MLQTSKGRQEKRKRVLLVLDLIVGAVVVDSWIGKSGSSRKIEYLTEEEVQAIAEEMLKSKVEKIEETELVNFTKDAKRDVMKWDIRFDALGKKGMMPLAYSGTTYDMDEIPVIERLINLRKNLMD